MPEEAPRLSDIDEIAERMRSIRKHAKGRGIADEMIPIIQDRFIKERTSYQDRASYMRAFKDKRTAGGLEPLMPGGQVASTMLQGATLGFGPRALATAREWTTDVPYEQALAAERAPISSFAGQHPKSAIGLEMAGGLGPATLEAQIARTIIPRGAKIPQRVASEGVIGGTGGALESVGTAEGELGLSQWPEAAIGGGIGLGGSIVPMISTPVVNRMTDPLSVDQQAAQATRDWVNDSGITAEQAVAQLTEGRDLGKPLTLADLSPDMRQKTAWLAVRPSPKRAEVQRFLERRAKEGGQRIKADIERETGKATRFFEDWIALDEQRRADAAPLYAQAYEDVQIPYTYELESFMQKPTVKDAWRRAQRSAANAGRQLPALFTEQDGKLALAARTPDLESLDYIKRALDDIVDASVNEQGRLTREGVEALQLKKDLLGLIDPHDEAAGRPYARARETYAGPSQMMTAMEDGMQLFTSPKKFDRLIYRTGRMSEGEKEAFRNGIRAGVVELIETSPEGANIANNLMKSQRRRDQLRQVFPPGPEGDAAMNRLMRSLQLEVEMKATSRAGSLAEGSRTEPLRMEGGKRGASRFEAGEMIYNPGIAIARQAYNAVETLSKGISEAQRERVFNRLTEIMTDPDPRAINRVLNSPIGGGRSPGQRTIDTLVQAALRSAVRQTGGWATPELQETFNAPN